ncbi:MAG: metalloregulator ArsR/SmtB family transcription factor [Nanoarchaeota archaeon]
MINKSILHECHNKGFSSDKMYGAYKIFFGTLVSEPRLKIINLLINGKKNVSEIMKEMDMNQTTVSHDLARLKQCGFVNFEIDKKYRYYSLNMETIKPLMNLIEKHMSKYCIHILKSMNGDNK